MSGAVVGRITPNAPRLQLQIDGARVFWRCDCGRVTFRILHPKASRDWSTEIPHECLCGKRVSFEVIARVTVSEFGGAI